MTRISFFATRPALRELFAALLVSFLLLAVTFPDVLFLRGGLSQTTSYYGETEGHPRVTLIPQPRHRTFVHAFADNGGGLWQSEPMQQFMKHCIYKGESPYWNPYSACGQLGPETLVDIKFSAQSILIALAGGSQLAFDLIVLLSYLSALTFLNLFVTRYLKLSFAAASACSTAYLLNGYNMATVATNTSQAYLYFPALLYALSAFAAKPTTWRFLAVVLLDAVTLSVTFIPTTTLMLLSVHALAAALAVSSWRESRAPLPRLLSTLVFFGIAGVLAALGLSFIYLPILESFKVVDALSMYSARQFYAVNLNSVLSFFSPRHFWEEYQAIPPILREMKSPFRIANTMCHVGVVTAAIASCSVLSQRFHHATFALGAGILFLLSMGRAFDVPPFTWLIELTPGLKNFGEQYWMIAIAIPFTMLVPFGFEAIMRKVKGIQFPVAAVLCVVAASMIHIYCAYGVHGPERGYKLACVLSVAAMIPLTAGAIYAARRKALSKAFSSFALIAMMVAELVFYSMHQRYVRFEYYNIPNPVLTFIKKHVGLQRVANLNIGFLPAEQGSAFQIHQIETLNMNILPTYEKMFDRKLLTEDIKWGRFSTLFRMNQRGNVNVRMLDLLGVKYLTVATVWTQMHPLLKANGWRPAISTYQWQLWENPNYVPRMFATSVLLERWGLPDDDKLPSRLVAYTEDKKFKKEADALGVTSTFAGGTIKIPDHAVTITSYHHAQITAEVSLPAPSVVVLTDNWHPNWKATVDGKPVYIGLVDESFRGIAVPAGHHRIEMKYMPATLPLALTVTSIVAGLLLLLVLLRKRFDQLLSKVCLNCPNQSPAVSPAISESQSIEKQLSLSGRS